MMPAERNRQNIKKKTNNIRHMCKYCEALTSDKMDAHGHKYRELLKTETCSNDIQDWEVMASVNPPTPISERRHKDDRLTSTLEVYFADDKRRVTHINIPIRHCPICGRLLLTEKRQYKSPYAYAIIGITIDPDWARNLPNELLSYQPDGTIKFQKDLLSEFHPEQHEALYEILSQSDTAKGLYRDFIPVSPEEAEFARCRNRYISEHTSTENFRDIHELYSREISLETEFALLQASAAENPATRRQLVADGILTEPACTPMEQIAILTENSKRQKLNESIEKLTQ